MTSTSKDTLMPSLPLQQQILLLALFTNIKRTDALVVPTK
jgi:hypothetical protein